LARTNATEVTEHLREREVAWDTRGASRNRKDETSLLALSGPAAKRPAPRFL
jgi:hypothetical protein